MLYDSIYMKCSEKANPDRKAIRVPRTTTGMGTECLTGTGFLLEWWIIQQWCLHNTVNVLKSTELYTIKWLKLSQLKILHILCIYSNQKPSNHSFLPITSLCNKCNSYSADYQSQIEFKSAVFSSLLLLLP